VDGALAGGGGGGGGALAFPVEQSGAEGQVAVAAGRADCSQGSGCSQSQTGERISTQGSPSRRLATASLRVRRSTA
jgi:hypothetical protein